MSKELFAGGGVQVTEAVARFRGVTYSIANIDSVQVGMRLSMPPMVIPTFIGGFVLTVIVGMVYPSFLLTLLCVSATFGASFFVPKGAPEAVLTLKTSSGDVQAYQSSDVGMVYKMQAAIIKAISTGK
jgi:hypothetical protein